MIVEDHRAVDLAQLPVGDDLLDLVVDRQECLIDVLDDRPAATALARVELVGTCPADVGDPVAQLRVLDQPGLLALLDDRGHVEVDRGPERVGLRPALDAQHLQQLVHRAHHTNHVPASQGS